MRPKYLRTSPSSPSPVQLALFADTACLARIRPALNEWRFYRMEVWPDLFGRALLMRQWVRIGTEGARRLDPYPAPDAAINALAQLALAQLALAQLALAQLATAKRRRGYQDRTP